MKCHQGLRYDYVEQTCDIPARAKCIIDALSGAVQTGAATPSGDAGANAGADASADNN